uniref:Uncharacterized protein n=1 Tax=Poecilia formosa TaxID=48698 RepID=A0A096M2A4_POEFO
MADKEDAGSELTYQNLLVLGAIAAASAFVVTILIVLVCVGCQSFTKLFHSTGKERKYIKLSLHVILNAQLKLRSRAAVSKSRPASMDLLLLHSRRSQTDLRPSHGRQLPQIPTSPQASDHTYTEVGLRNNPTPTRYLDDGLYESVGIREGEAAPRVPSAPLTSSSSTPSTIDRKHDGTETNRSPLSSVNSLVNQDPAAAEYASIRKYKKVDKLSRKENNGADSMSDSQSSVSDSPSAGPLPLHRSQEFPRKPLEPFHLHSFPKEAVFIGNGEQYIWKPPEDDDIIKKHLLVSPYKPCFSDSDSSAACAIADTYSIVCKTPPMEHNGAKTLPRSFGGGRGNRGRGRGVQGQARSQEEPCYEPVGDRSWSSPVAESDPAYASIDAHRKREQGATNNSTGGGSATLKRKKQSPPLQGSGPIAPPVKGLPGGENFYETISDVKQGGNTSGTTTIFTFNDGMEMYVTGL